MLETIVLSFAVGSLFGAVVISWIARVQMEKKSADPDFKFPLMATTYAFSTTEDRDNFASGLTK